jgi:BirA family transcriptional regulator, biotin operon repressor / biotin---[acetyl-CoA-carboxylase] ligase
VAAGEGHGTAVIALEQTTGRGRRGRSWFSPKGNLHCSIILDPGPERARVSELVFVAAIALRAALAELAPSARFACKWPNDVLCMSAERGHADACKHDGAVAQSAERRLNDNGAKIAGMLLELAAPWVILGVGVNVVAAPPAGDTLYPATALARTGSTADLDAVYTGFVGHLERAYRLWRDEGFIVIRRTWLEHAAGVGEPVTVRLADASVLEGRFGGLDAAGALLLDAADGTRRPVLAGDVFFAA